MPFDLVRIDKTKTILARAAALWEASFHVCNGSDDALAAELRVFELFGAEINDDRLLAPSHPSHDALRCRVGRGPQNTGAYVERGARCGVPSYNVCTRGYIENDESADERPMDGDHVIVSS
jgi:hypothetical protein